jgi:hypothetical protein
MWSSFHQGAEDIAKTAKIATQNAKGVDRKGPLWRAGHVNASTARISSKSELSPTAAD